MIDDDRKNCGCGNDPCITYGKQEDTDTVEYYYEQKEILRDIIREALSTMVPDIAPRRKSSWQAHKERKDASMAADMAKMDAFIKQVADQLKADPASAGDILTTFQPALGLDKHFMSMEGALRMDDFLDKIENDLQDLGVDRVAALKFSDSFLKFR